jgi:hypothetical protein
MAVDLHQAVSRWLAAEHRTDEAAAEAALTHVFGAMPAIAAPRGLTARIVRAACQVPLGAERRPLRSGRRRAARIGGILTGAGAAAYLVVRLLLPVLVSGFGRLIGL